MNTVACGRETREGAGSIYSVVHKDSIVKDIVVCVLAKKNQFRNPDTGCFPKYKTRKISKGSTMDEKHQIQVCHVLILRWSEKT